MDRKVNIEIVPWVHNFSAPVHELVIKFIRTLPRNSTIALEATEESLRTYMDKPKRILETTMSNENSQTRDTALAFFEVVHECMKKNIKLIPIDTRMLVQKQELLNSSGFEQRRRLEIERVSMARDHAFARKIKTQLSTFKSEKIPILIGIGHAGGVHKELKVLGINSRIDTTFFGRDKTFMERVIKIVAEQRTAVLESNGDLLDYKIHELFLLFKSLKPRKVDTQARVGRMFEEIEERDKTAQDANKKRHEKRRQKAQKQLERQNRP